MLANRAGEFTGPLRSCKRQTQLAFLRGVAGRYLQQQFRQAFGTERFQILRVTGLSNLCMKVIRKLKGSYPGTSEPRNETT